MKKLVYISFLLLLACAPGKQEGVITITIDTDKARQADISEFIDSVRFIKLETTSENLIHHLSKVFFTRERIVLFDRLEQRVLVFDNRGNYLHKIEKQGRGPGEYVDASALLFDPDRGTIMVYDAGTKKLLFYTLDGTFVKEITGFSNNATIRDIINLPGGHFLCYTFDRTLEKAGEKASGLWEVDSSGNFTRSFFTIPDLYPVVHTFDNSQFGLLEGGAISIRDARFNDIYHLEGDSLRKHVAYKIKHDNLHLFKGLSYTPEKFTKSLTSQEKGDYIFTYWMGIDERFYTVYSRKENQTALIYPVEAFWEGHKVAKPMSYLFKDSNRTDILLTAVLGMEIPEFLEKEDADPAVKAALREIIAGMSEKEIDDMNPVLQLLYVKEW
jgi:hypothetical protein